MLDIFGPLNVVVVAPFQGPSSNCFLGNFRVMERLFLLICPCAWGTRFING